MKLKQKIGQLTTLFESVSRIKCLLSYNVINLQKSKQNIII